MNSSDTWVCFAFSLNNICKKMMFKFILSCYAHQQLALKLQHMASNGMVLADVKCI